VPSVCQFESSGAAFALCWGAQHTGGPSATIKDDQFVQQFSDRHTKCKKQNGCQKEKENVSSIYSLLLETPKKLSLSFHLLSPTQTTLLSSPIKV